MPLKTARLLVGVAFIISAVLNAREELPKLGLLIPAPGSPLATAVYAVLGLTILPIVPWDRWLPAAFRHVRNTVFPAARPVQMAAPVGRLPLGVRGRSHLLRELAGQRRRGGLGVLVGMGGVGKSTVATEFVRRVQARGNLVPWRRAQPVWWISGATAASLTDGLVRVVRELGASEEDLRAVNAQAPDAPDRMWRLLEHSSHRWVLVIDNSDDPSRLAAPCVPVEDPQAKGEPIPQVADGTGWVRSTRRGLVLVTSRHRDPSAWGHEAVIHEVRPLNDQESGRVLRDLAPSPEAGDRAEAEALGSRLGGLPLALHLAGLNVGSGITRWPTFRAFLQALDRDAVADQLLAADADTELARDERAIVMRTWELSLDTLADHGLPEARALLRLLSCYSPALPIPLDLLDPDLVAPLLDGSGTAATLPKHPSEQVLRGLARLGLIDSVAGQQAVALHPVVADTNRAHLRAPTSEADPDPLLVRETAVALLVAAVDRLDPAQSNDWPRYRQLAPHVVALLNAAGAYLADGPLATLIGCAWSVSNGYLNAGSPNRASQGANTPPIRSMDAMTITRSALAFSERLGAEHVKILALQDQLAHEMGRMGHWIDAEEIARRVLDARERTLGADHEDTLSSREGLSLELAGQGRLHEAELGFRENLDASQRVRGADHPSTLSIRNNLAGNLLGQRRWKEAESILSGLVEAMRREKGDDHPDTLMVRHNLIGASRHLGRSSAEAEASYRQLLSDQQRVLGAHHHDTLWTRFNLAGTLTEQGRWRDAARIYAEVLEDERRVLGAAHPTTLAAQRDLALAMANLGRWGQAESLCREVLEIRRGSLGAGHPDTLASHRDLAWIIANRRARHV